jgi:hypothetical protein
MPGTPDQRPHAVWRSDIASSKAAMYVGRTLNALTRASQIKLARTAREMPWKWELQEGTKMRLTEHNG